MPDSTPLNHRGTLTPPDKNIIMKLDNIIIEGMELKDEYFVRGRSKWKQTTLISCIKEQGCNVFDMPLIGLNLTEIHFDCDNFVLFMHHCKRVADVDIKHPIILDDFGQIANGRHRVARAILDGQTSIKAVRLKYMPKPDKIKKK